MPVAFNTKTNCSVSVQLRKHTGFSKILSQNETAAALKGVCVSFYEDKWNQIFSSSRDLKLSLIQF